MGETGQFFRVAEIAKMVGISPSTLRNWENHRLIAPSRSEGEHRLYSEGDLERIRQINWLRRVQSLNLAAIKAVMNAVGEEDPSGSKAAPPPLPLGQKLKELRRRSGLTLKQVGTATGLPISLISTLERTSTGASMASLTALANCYDTLVTDLLAPVQETDTRVIRRGRGRRVGVLGPSISVEQLAEGRTEMDCQRWRLQPGAASEGAYSHEGEEFIHVLSGVFEITLGGAEVHRLEDGDSIYFPSNLSHAWRNPSSSVTLLLWVSTPRTFQPKASRG